MLAWSPSNTGTVKTAEYGENWTDKEALIFGNVSDSSTRGGVSSSSGGCEEGYSVLRLITLAVMVRRKIH